MEIYVHEIILLLHIKKSERVVKDRPTDELVHQILFLQKAFVEEGVSVGFCLHN